MDNIDSSPGQDGPSRTSADAAAAPGGTVMRGLLSAAEIWATASDAAAASDPAALANSSEAKPSEAKPSEIESPEKADMAENVALARNLRPSEIMAQFRSFSSSGRRTVSAAPIVQPESQALAWPPRRLSLALQGGGSFAAFTWGVLDRLLEEPDLSFDAISGASAGAVNAALLACGLVEGGRQRAQTRLERFWTRIGHEASFRSLMLIGGFSPASSAVTFGPALRSGQLDPLDLDPLREALFGEIDFSALRAPSCPKLLIAATRVRDGRPQVFGNAEITADAVLASICPPLVNGAVEIDGAACWDGAYGANPPLIRLVQDSAPADLLVVQVTPTRDTTIPVTAAAIDRRLDQIVANAALGAELAALEWAREIAPSLQRLRIHRIAAEDEIEGLAQRNQADLGRSFITLLRERGFAAADRWLRLTGAARSTPRQVQAAPEEPVLA